MIYKVLCSLITQMIEEQNPWWLGREHIYEHEVFRRYADSKVKWVPDVLGKLSLEPYSLNFIVGARQVGKSTALLLLANTLLDRVKPEAVFYFSCDKLADYRELDQVLVEYLRFKERSGVESAYILLDEVTFPREWYRAVKYRVDRGDFSRDVLVLSGSLSMRAKREIETFPGRRGGGRTLLMSPLSFSEFVEIHGVRTPRGDIGYALTESQRLLPLSSRLSELFEVYLESGGFPNPVRDIMVEGRVRSSTSSDFISSVSADLAKLRRSETFFKLAVRGILEKASSQVSYHTIAKEFGVGTVKTAISYIDLLRDLYLLNMLEAVDPSSGLPLPKKEKKLYFTDPFIYHSFSKWVMTTPPDTTKLAEAAVVNHLSLVGNPGYIKLDGEVDIALTGLGLAFEVKYGAKETPTRRVIGKLKKVYTLSKTTIDDGVIPIPLFLASLKVGAKQVELA